MSIHKEPFSSLEEVWKHMNSDKWVLTRDNVLCTIYGLDRTGTITVMSRDGDMITWPYQNLIPLTKKEANKLINSNE